MVVMTQILTTPGIQLVGPLPPEIQSYITFAGAVGGQRSVSFAGNIKAYAIATTERHPALSNVPTTVEAGLPEYLASAWFALFEPILDKLTNALGQTLAYQVGINQAALR